MKFFRLPAKVNCFSETHKINVEGVRGAVSFKAVSKTLQSGKTIQFVPALTAYEASVFKQSVLGVLYGYEMSIQLKGIGYKVTKIGKTLTFNLGYSLPVIIKIPVEVKVWVTSKTLTLFSVNYGVLQNFAMTVRSYRSPDPYKGKGILYGEETVILKEGKKT